MNNDDISAGVVPKKTKATTTVVKGLDATRFFGVIAVIVLTNFVGEIFGGVGKYLFMGFSVVVFFVLTSKAPSNPTEPFYVGLIRFAKFMCRNKTYYGTHSKQYQDFEENKENAKYKKAKNKDRTRKKDKD